MFGVDKAERNIELAFAAFFSILVFLLFFFIVGANGLILGNDPAVHLQRAEMFLNAGRIPLSDIAWYPPLYHIVLATFMAFTGATSVDQMLVLMKAVTALINCLLVFSVYLIAAKFFSKKTGALAAALLLLCFPLYEINSWGGYTSVLSMAFMVLAFMYLASPLKSAWSSLLTFTLGFSVVMSHQLATFLSVFILPPFVIVVLVRSKGHYPKALIAALLGGGIAFLIYYLMPILPYLGDIVSIVFFQAKTMIYQIPAVSFNEFMTNFGFVLFLAFAGFAVGFFELRKKKFLSFYLLLSMAFIVPLFLSQSYLVGIYLPYQWFVYYLIPPLAVFAAVSLSFLIDAVSLSYFNNKKGWKNVVLKTVSVATVIVLVAVMLVRFQTVSGKIGEGTTYYSISDVNSYNAGSWIKSNFPDLPDQIVVTEKPGHWFSVFSGKPVIGETNPVVEWNYNAESVLDLSYEMNHPLTMVRVYQAKGDISDDNYIFVNMVWTRVAYFTENTASFSFRDENNTVHTYPLSSLNRTIAIDEVHYPKSIRINYSGDGFALTENLLVSNNSYPITVTWQVSALQGDLNYATLYLNYIFDPMFSFNTAYIPRVLNWENPWNNTSTIRDGWAVTNYSDANLTADNHVSAYDENNKAAFSLQFDDLPDFGNIGVSANRNIDAVRFEYRFFKVDANYTLSRTYQLLTFSQSSLPSLENLTEMNTLFDYKTTEPFNVECRNFASIIRDNYIGFIVYDSSRFNPSVLSSKWLELVYSNDKYVVTKIRSDHSYPNVLENTTR